MKEPRKIFSTEQGYGIVGVNVFFSVQDAFKLHDIVSSLMGASDTSSEIYREAIGNLIALSDKISHELYSEQKSIFGDELH